MRSNPWRAGAASLGLALTLGVPPAAAQPAASDAAYPDTIELAVDATDLATRILRVRERVPAAPGPLALQFPRFLPGTHGPYGAIDRLAGLQVRAAGAQLPWRRDEVDPYRFHVDVPAGAQGVEIDFQFLSALDPESGRVVVTSQMANLQWASVVLYPVGWRAERIRVAPSVRLPAGWAQASALDVRRDADGAAGHEFAYAPVSLETLVDSPLYAGRHLRRVALDGPGAARPVVLNIVADEAALLEIDEAKLAAHRALVEQAERLFASRHFRRYEFLLSLSQYMSGIGLEHHESSENGVRTDYFKDWDKRVAARELLPHEFTHSWNGKYRRPADLWTPDFHQPMRNSLLWLYEGQTQYWGKVLAVRAGLVTPEQARDRWAATAAWAEHRAGRRWRSLQDTTNEGTIASHRDAEWRSWQRGVDYYDEAALVWLDADTWIREASGGARSLDDFARRFFGVHDGRVEPLTYTFDDIVAALDAVQPRDWRAFLRERLDRTGGPAPLDGLARAGWQLVYKDTASRFGREDDPHAPADDFVYSLGLLVGREGRLVDVLWGSPAHEAGLSRAAQLVAVQGEAYKAERLERALRANRDGKAPIELLVREADRFRSLRIDYRGGPRHPHLQRLDGQPERLDAGVLAPRPAGAPPA